MKVVLLCAGYATRLYPLTENQPKPLLPVADKPILQFILDRLQTVKDVRGVYIISNHKFAGHFEKWAKTLNYPWQVESVDDQTTSNDNRLGAIGDLYYVVKQKKIGQEDLMVIAGDNLFDFDLQEFIKQAHAKRPHAVIATYDVKDKILASQYGLVRHQEDGQVIEFLEKPKNPPTTLASCGLYYLPKETRHLLDRYVQEAHNLDQPGLYMKWLSEVDKVYAASLKGLWYDIGDLKSYEQANQFFMQSRKKS